MCVCVCVCVFVCAPARVSVVSKINLTTAIHFACLPRKTGFAFSSEEEEEVRVVRSLKDKR